MILRAEPRTVIRKATRAALKSRASFDEMRGGLCGQWDRARADDQAVQGGGPSVPLWQS
jgi:hypothetical protein